MALSGISGLSGLAIAGRSLSHVQKILSESPSTVIDVWPFDETSGTTALATLSSSRNGSYRSGATPGTSWPAASGLSYFRAPGLLPSTGDILLPAANLASGFPWAEGSVSLWMRASAGAWDENTLRRPLLLQIDSNNRIFVQKSAGTDTLTVTRTGGGTSRTITIADVTKYCGLGWLLLTVTWSIVNDVMNVYLNDVLVGTVSSLTAITGTLSICILAGNPYFPSSTYSHLSIRNAPLSASEVRTLALDPTRDRLLVFEGDSLTVGGQSGAVPYPKTLMRTMTEECAGIHVATSGQKVNQMVSSYTTEIAPYYNPGTYRKNTLCVLGGANDIQNESYTVAYDRLKQLWALARSTGFQVIASTLPAGNPSGSSNPYNSYRNQLNTLILSDTSLYTAVARPDLNANIGQDGDENNTTYFNSDKLHLTSSGNSQLAAAFYAVMP